MTPTPSVENWEERFDERMKRAIGFTTERLSPTQIADLKRFFGEELAHQDRESRKAEREELREKFKGDTLPTLIGYGVHCGLRKRADSKASSTAWKAINDMPDGEWDYIVEEVVKEVRALLPIEASTHENG